MENKLARYTSGRFFFGLVLLVLGSLYLMHNFGFIYVGHISRFWPVLFILFGIARLLDYDGTNHRGSGIGLIFFGSWLLISMNGMFDLDFHDSWPILIIGWGVSILWKAYVRQERITIAEEQHHGN
jgi:hypothetical protein